MYELKVFRDGESRIIQFEGNPLLDEVLEANGFFLPHPCGGRGVCRKCAVTLSGAVSEPDDTEKKFGVRLACRTVLLGNAQVYLPASKEMEQIEISGVRDKLMPSGEAGTFGAAIDIGTTTVAARLFDLYTGKCLSETGMSNPQTSVAADVMGRIDAALKGNLSLLQNQILSALETVLKSLCNQAGIALSDVNHLSITGNTTMLYLLTGRSPEALSHAPFYADHLFDETVRLFDIPTYLPPCMNAFVGADITCAVMASGMCEKHRTALLADIGTNGEIALWKDGVLSVTSTAAGPVFEGAGISCGCSSVRGAIDQVGVELNQLKIHTIGDAKPVGICGSGLIDAVAAFLELGIVDETGACEDDDLKLCGEVSLQVRDIRALQLGKAAIAAGIDTLLAQAKVSPDEIEAFYIAGGFGSHLNVLHAAAIGLFPWDLVSKTKVIGNAALSGAENTLTQPESIEKMRKIAESSVHVNLGGNPMFNERYMDNMFFPETES